MDRQIRVYPTMQEATAAAADYLLRLGLPPQDATRIGRLRPHTVALAGGATPSHLFRWIVSQRPDLAQAREQDTEAGEGVEAFGPPFLYAHVFWSDERCVPPSSEDSNSGRARRELLDPLGFEPTRIHAVDTTLTPAAAAERYELQLHHVFAEIWQEESRMAALMCPPDAAPCATAPDPDRWERPDLVMLGLGADGHTASLFSGEAALQEKTRWVVATRHPSTGEDRVTFSLPLLSRARRILVVALGEDKAEAVRRSFEPGPDDQSLPLALIGGEGRMQVILDQAAASRLTRSGSGREGSTEPK